MTVWRLLKDYVREFEIANDVQFSNEAWQRVKKLERDILAVQSSAENEARELHQKTLQERDTKLKAVEALCDAVYPPWMADFARKQNSEAFIRAYENGWSNGANLVQDQILIALGIKPSAEAAIEAMRQKDEAAK